MNPIPFQFKEAAKKQSILGKIGSAIKKATHALEKGLKAVEEFGKKNPNLGLIVGLAALAGGLAAAALGGPVGIFFGVPMAATGVMLLSGAVPVKLSEWFTPKPSAA